MLGTDLPYKRKYWRALNLAIWLQTEHSKILAELSRPRSPGANYWLSLIWRFKPRQSNRQNIGNIGGNYPGQYLVLILSGNIYGSRPDSLSAPCENLASETKVSSSNNKRMLKATSFLRRGVLHTIPLYLVNIQMYFCDHFT